ncbi:MAG: UDP-N-acetyl-D-glucosamine dehydrogenase, partial [bacterium]
AEFIELAGKVNQNMPYHCVARVERVLNDAAKPVRGSRIAIFGVSYKAGVGDLRESPALKIIEVLRGLGGDIVYHDPHVASLPEFDLHSVPVDAALDGADMAVIVTAHPGVDHDAIVERAPMALDLRGATRKRVDDRSTVQL